METRFFWFVRLGEQMFKSYYVVWKLFPAGIANVDTVCLNRTM